jgi:hypothetical protein
MNQIFVWTLRDVLGLCALGAVGLFVLGVIVYVQITEWRKRKNKNRKK